MELRHLRYFVAVADAGSLTVAAQRMLHTSQPSLSRQIRDLEDEVGTPLLTRRARGVDLTPAGRAFLDHARSVLSQVEAASEAARRVAGPAKPWFAMGFLTGHELTWMPEALRILRDELPNIAAAPGENGTCGVKNYVKRVGCIFQTTKSSREILTEPSLLLHSSGAWNSARSPLPTTFISKNHRAVSTRAPYGESFAATTNLRRENQSPNLHKSRIATSAP